MIIPATVDYLAPKFRAGLVTAIYTPKDVADMIAAAEHRGEVVR